MPSDLEDFADSLLIEGRVYNEHDQDLFQERTGTASQSDVNTIETDLSNVTGRVTIAEADIDALTATINGVVVGVTYVVPNKADLPATVNGTPKAVFGTVYKDNISSDNNGTYYQDPGVAIWVKVPGDLTIRVINLENNTAIFDVYPGQLYYEGVELRHVCRSPDDDLYWAVDINGKFILFGNDLQPGSITTAMLVDLSVTTAKLADLSVTTAKIADKAVTTAKISDIISRSIANDYIPSMPDNVRSFEQDGVLGIYTETTWTVLPREVTSVIEGINNSGISLDFRPTSGLHYAGQRRRGTYDPSAVGNSIVIKGEISSASAWPPVGTFIDGDYYQYTEPTVTRVIGSDTLRFADLMVYKTGAWSYKASPGSGTTVYRRDWWEVSVNGVYEGITLLVGDRLVVAAYQNNSPRAYRRWRKGLPSKRECFRCGEFSPLAGLPTTPTPMDRDLWDVSVSGEAGGFTFVAGDMLLRTGAVWTHVPMSPFKTVPDATGFILTCDYTSAEWEVRRTDKSTIARQGYASIRGGFVQRRSTEGIGLVGYADYMGTQVFPVVATALGRPVTNNSYGTATSDDIEGMAEWNISQGDLDKGKPMITMVGQSSGGAIGRMMATRIRLERMMATGDKRFVHLTSLGLRTMTWDGTILRCPNFEEQWVDGSTNIFALDVKNLKSTRPYNYIWSAKLLGDASIGDTGPSYQWPTKTNEQVWNEYKIPALKYCRSFTPSDGLTYCTNHVGQWSSPSMPTGGVSGDYYIAITGAAIAVGFFIANKNGVWTNVTWDTTRLSVAGDTIIGNGIAAFFVQKGW